MDLTTKDLDDWDYRGFARDWGEHFVANHRHSVAATYTQALDHALGTLGSVLAVGVPNTGHGGLASVACARLMTASTMAAKAAMLAKKAAQEYELVAPGQGVSVKPLIDELKHDLGNERWRRVFAGRSFYTEAQVIRLEMDFLEIGRAHV